MIHQEMPKISVLMPVWNAERYLAEAVESILGQTFSNFEFLIIDDGSTDQSLRIIKSYQDPRIRVFGLGHGGIVQALNFGVENASAEWVARMDADDVSAPDRLEVQWRALSRSPQAVLCFTDVKEFGQECRPGPRARLPRTRAFMALSLCRRCPISHGTVIFQKRAAKAAGLYREDERHAEDFGLWGRMLWLGPFLCVPRKLIRLRVHASSISFHQQTTQKALAEKICRRHLGQFMDVEGEVLQKTYLILQSKPSARKVGDWLWFIRNCFGRLRWQSLELWGWLAFETIRCLCRRPNLFK